MISQSIIIALLFDWKKLPALLPRWENKGLPLRNLSCNCHAVLLKSNTSPLNTKIDPKPLNSAIHRDFETGSLSRDRAILSVGCLRLQRCFQRVRVEITPFRVRQGVKLNTSLFRKPRLLHHNSGRRWALAGTNTKIRFTVKTERNHTTHVQYIFTYNPENMPILSLILAFFKMEFQSTINKFTRNKTII